MAAPVLARQLYIPPPRSKAILRPHLIEQMNAGLQAGFGKTTLLGEWIASWGRPAAWVSLDEEDSDLTVFFNVHHRGPTGGFSEFR